MIEKKYLIIALRYWNNSENVLFWGKNQSGYETDLAKVGLYTKEEAKRICKSGHNKDCYISIDTLGITEEAMRLISENVKVVVPKSRKVAHYANTWENINRNLNALKYGE